MSTSEATSDQDQFSWMNFEFVKNLNEPGGPVLFENRSDTIFASLFLPVFTKSTLDLSDVYASIPWQFCDVMLSAFRNPQFNSKEVTFENSADMFKLIGRKREESWLVAEARGTNSTPFPQVIPEGVFNLLREELEVNMKLARENNWLYPTWGRIRGDRWVPVEDLQSMMLVHSSWRACTRRLLGYAVDSDGGLGPNRVQNPLFGLWTRELHLSYLGRDLETEAPSLSSPNFMQPQERQQLHFLRSFSSRIPGTRLACISISQFSLAFPHKFIRDLCGSLVLFSALEELSLSTDEEHFEFFQLVSTSLSQAPHPSLRNLCIYAGFYKRFDGLKQTDLLSLLATLPKLELVQLSQYGPRLKSERPNFAIGGVSWGRVPSESRPLRQFAVEKLRVDCNLQSFPEDDLSGPIDQMAEMLTSASLIELFVVDDLVFTDSPEDNVRAANVLAPLIDKCRHISVRKLIFRDLRWSRIGMITHLEDRLRAIINLQELALIFSPFQIIPLSQCSGSDVDLLNLHLNENDALLSEAIAHGGVIPRSCSLHLQLEDDRYGTTYDFCVCDCENTGSGGHEGHVLPLCRRACVERGIQLYINQS